MSAKRPLVIYDGKISELRDSDWLSVGVPSFQRFIFATPSSEWVVNHNMATTYFLTTIRDSDNNLMVGAVVDIIDESTFIVRFTGAEAGHIDVLFAPYS
jgi:hypothetical protein